MTTCSRELAQALVKTRRQESIALRVTIFLVVLIMGTYLFSISLSWQQQILAAQAVEGDYHFILSGLNANMLAALAQDSPEKITFDQEEISQTPGDTLYQVKVRCNNIRDSYTYSRHWLSRQGLSEAELLQAGQLTYHTRLLELQGVFSDGFTPQGDTVLPYLVFLVLILLMFLLFAFLLASNFRQWQTQNYSEFALLQSVGMDSKILKSFLLWCAYYLSLGPILLGTLCAYLLGSGLKALVWHFLQRSYETFHLNYHVDYSGLRPRLQPFILLLLLSALCLYVATLQAWSSAKTINMTEAIRTRFPVDTERTIKSENFVIAPQRVEAGLARTFRAFYRKHARNLLLLIALSSTLVSTAIYYEANSGWEGQAPNHTGNYTVERIFWTRTKPASELQSALDTLSARQKLQISVENMSDRQYFHLKGDCATPEEAAELDQLLRETVEKYLTPDHWVGLGSIQNHILDQGEVLASRIRLSIWLVALTALSAVHSFQSFFSLYLGRAQEFITLRSLGMTGRQLKKLLHYELLYALSGILLLVAGEFAVLSLFISLIDPGTSNLLSLWREINFLPFLLYLGLVIASAWAGLGAAVSWLRKAHYKNPQV